ncbi:MAG: DUF2254 domain-containing protein [Myxococcales bacterium]|nr:DUF2254 domain-containing protein [Myxococcales bacterium]
MAALIDRRTMRVWMYPFASLLGIAVTLLLFTFWIDGGGDLSVLDLFLRPNAGAAEATLTNAAQVVANILEIAITVVAIVAELAANRYTHRVTELFVREPINLIVMSFFVLTTVQCVFVPLGLNANASGVGFVPYWGIRVTLVMLAVSLLILLPYFAYVFDFLSPVNIVQSIQEHTVRAIGSRRRLSVEQRKDEAIRGVEQLADVALNAMENHDKGVAMASLDALQTMALEYQAMRSKLGSAWFRLDGTLAHNPDFVSMSEQVHDEITERRIWFEMKVLRKYQTLYNAGLNRMRDINYVVAINTRHIGEEAIRLGHQQLFELVIKFFNTYLRSTVNASDVRTGYNVLHQYRLLASEALERGDDAHALRMAEYFKYYGQLAFQARLPFILETVAHDLVSLTERAFELKSPALEDLVSILLEVDKESEGAVQEQSLRGVRKAQVGAAAYFLAHDREDLARRVYEDMAGEPRDRLASIRDELLHVESREFWEVSDRGVNFDYLEPELKRELARFFRWFDGLRAVRPSTMPAALLTARPSMVEEPAPAGPGFGLDPGQR